MRTVSEYIIDYLIEQEVEYILGIPGHGCLPLFDAIRRRGDKIKYIQVKQEMAAVHMADGYFRATGRPLAVFTSIGPGALNTIIGLATSYVDSTAVLVFCGEAHTHMRGTGVLQEIERRHDSDFLSCMRPVAKRSWRVETADQIPKIMNRAFTEMASGRKGPCVVCLPMDIQAEETKAKVPEKNKYNPILPTADTGEVKKAYEILVRAKRPIIVAGGATYYARMGEKIAELSENFGAPIVTTMASKSVITENHPLYAFHGGSKGTDIGNKICSKADVILSLGCRFADESTSSYRKGITYDFEKTKLIQVDIDPGEIGKNYKCELGIVSDVASFTDSLNLLCGSKKDYRSTEYYKELSKLKEEWFKKIDNVRKADVYPPSISQYLGIMNEFLPDDTVICTSSGNTQAQILQEYIFKKPNTHVTTGGFSTMGFAFPAAMGVKLSSEDRPVAAVLGDGDFMMAIQEMSTAVQYNIPILIFVFNNMGWFAIKDLQIDVFGKENAFGNDFTNNAGELYSPQFDKIAENFGMASEKVGSLEGLKKAIKKHGHTKTPVFIEIICNRIHPYSGGGATGWWDVPVPYYYPERHKKYLEGKAQEQHIK